MKEKDPLENLLDQITAALSIIHENEHKKLTGNISKEDLTNLDNLKIITELLDTKCKELLAENGISEEEAEKTVRSIPGTLDKQTQQFLQRTAKIKEEMTSLQREFVLKAKKNSATPSELASGTQGEKGQDVGKKRKQRAAKNIGFKGWQRL